MCRYILFLSFMLSTLPVLAQQPALVIKVGMSSSTIHLAGAVNSDRQLGGLAGIGLVLKLSQDKRWQLAPDLLYTVKGGRYQVGSQVYSERLHYLDLLVPARYVIKQLYIEAGPQVSYFLGSATEGPVNTSYHRLVGGLGGGIGYQFASGPFVMVRYTYDLTPLDNRVFEVGRERNAVLQLQVGYALHKERQ